MKYSDRIIALLNTFNPEIGSAVAIEKTLRGVKIVSPLAEYVIEVGDAVGCSQDASGHNHVCVVTEELLERDGKRSVEALLRRLFIGDPDLHPQLSAKEIRLTDPQFECLDAFENSLVEGESAGAIVLPTAMGKTVVAAFAIEMAKKTIGARTVLFLASQTELLDGAHRRFQASIPRRSLGRFYGKHAGKEDGDIILATVQSSARLKEFRRGHFDLVIVDEFHHVMSDTYKELWRHFTPMYRLGLSATPFRGDGQDPVSAFDGNYLCHKTLKDVVLDGYVSPPDWRLIQDVTDYSGILSPTTGREITFVSAARELIVPEREAIIIDAYRRLAVGRTVGFCYSSKQALRMTQVFRAAGVQADIFTGEHSSVNGLRVKDRDETLEAFRRGDTRVLFTVDLFNEGVDVPEIETVLFLRFTKSPGRLLQNIGRGLRLAPGKRAVRILDFMSNYDRAEALVNLGRILGLGGGVRPKSEGGDGDADDKQLIEMGIEIKVTEEAKKLIRETLEEMESKRRDVRLGVMFECFERSHALGNYDEAIALECLGLGDKKTVDQVREWRYRTGRPCHEKKDALFECYRKAYEAGATDADMAEECHGTPKSASKWRYKNKLPPNRESSKAFVLFKKSYDLGRSDEEIAADCDRHVNSVRKWRARVGLPLNKRKKTGIPPGRGLANPPSPALVLADSPAGRNLLMLDSAALKSLAESGSFWNGTCPAGLGLATVSGGRVTRQVARDGWLHGLLAAARSVISGEITALEGQFRAGEDAIEATAAELGVSADEVVGALLEDGEAWGEWVAAGAAL